MTAPVTYCDVCNEETQNIPALRATPEMFRKLLSRGWGVHQTNIKMLARDGVSIESATMILTMQAAMSQSDWLLCTHCKGIADHLLSK